MKVTIGLDGQVAFDTESIDQAVAMVRALRNGVAAPAQPEEKPTPAPKGATKPRRRIVKHEDLSRQAYETWEWLVANDDIDGIPVNKIADALGIQRHAATWRCNQLIEKGLAHRICRGRYRPGETPDEVVRQEDPVTASEGDAEPQ